VSSRALLLWGLASIEVVDGVPREYLAASKKAMNHAELEKFEETGARGVRPDGSHRRRAALGAVLRLRNRPP
jgi:hypothetical protein